MADPADPDRAGGDGQDQSQQQERLDSGGHEQGQTQISGQQGQQLLRLRRLSYTTPATPFVDTPAAHPSLAPSHALPLSSLDSPFNLDQDEGKLPAAGSGAGHNHGVPDSARAGAGATAGPAGSSSSNNNGSNNGSSNSNNPVAVDSHLRLDDIRRPPWNHHRPRIGIGASLDSASVAGVSAAAAAGARNEGTTAASSSNTTAAAAAQPSSQPPWARPSSTQPSSQQPSSQSSHQSPQPSSPQQSPQQAGLNPTPQTRSSALLSAKYYAAATLAKIPPNLADRAVRSAHGAFKVSLLYCCIEVWCVGY